MLGAYRLILALLVALSHNGVEIAGLDPGVIAVIGFYLISGYVMTGLLRSHYATIRKAGGFYLDRVLRLLPHYLVIAAITMVWFLATGTRTEYLRVAPTAADVVQNLLIVPLNFYMFNHADAFTLIPPAWSLGAEVQFYVLAPFLLLASQSAWRNVALAASALVYAIASFGVINSDWYGYRLLVGILFVFMLGSIHYDLHQREDWRSRSWLVFAGVAAVAATLALVLAHGGKILLPYDRETLIGLVIGIAAINLLARRRRHVVDDTLGNVSYGVFLCHYMVRWTFFDGRVEGVANEIVFLGIAVVIATLLYNVVERPILAFRRKLRKAAPRPATPEVSQ